MFDSFCSLVLRQLLQLVILRVRSNEWKELEVVVLRHELAILWRQTRRPTIAALTGSCLPLPAAATPRPLAVPSMRSQLVAVDPPPLRIQLLHLLQIFGCQLVVMIKVLADRLENSHYPLILTYRGRSVRVD